MTYLFNIITYLRYKTPNLLISETHMLVTSKAQGGHDLDLGAMLTGEWVTTCHLIISNNLEQSRAHLIYDMYEICVVKR